MLSPRADEARARLTTLLVPLIILTLFTSGCSFLFSKGPKPDEYDDMGNIDCSGYTAPVLDAIWAGLNAIGAMQAAAATDETWKRDQPEYDRSTVMTSGFLWLAISGTSAIYGLSNASACERARAEMLTNSRRRHRYQREGYEPQRLPPLTGGPRPAAAPAPPAPTAPASAPAATPTTDDDPFAAP